LSDQRLLPFFSVLRRRSSLLVIRLSGGVLLQLLFPFPTTGSALRCSVPLHASLKLSFTSCQGSPPLFFFYVRRDALGAAIFSLEWALETFFSPQKSVGDPPFQAADQARSSPFSLPRGARHSPPPFSGKGQSGVLSLWRSAHPSEGRRLSFSTRNTAALLRGERTSSPLYIDRLFNSVSPEEVIRTMHFLLISVVTTSFFPQRLRVLLPFNSPRRPQGGDNGAFFLPRLEDAIEALLFIDHSMLFAFFVEKFGWPCLPSCLGGDVGGVSFSARIPYTSARDAIYSSPSEGFSPLFS